MNIDSKSWALFGLNLSDGLITSSKQTYFNTGKYCDWSLSKIEFYLKYKHLAIDNNCLIFSFIPDAEFWICENFEFIDNFCIRCECVCLEWIQKFTITKLFTWKYLKKIECIVLLLSYHKKMLMRAQWFLFNDWYHLDSGSRWVLFLG